MINLAPDELVVDYFAGGGGASSGIEEAIGRPIDMALNHDPEAVAMHAANHPGTKHYCKDAWEADPLEVTQGRPVGLAWFSPDCKHFSRAKGGKPVSKRVRGLAWVVVKWAKAVRPRVIMLENVSEFATWGPLLEDGTPCNIRKGFTFRRWCKMLQNLGYELDMRELVAAKYGAGTTRKRLYIILRCDGQPIVWPEETHGPGLLPYVTAAECIDWSIPCPSIFERSKPLADATLRRIARGITRYVVNNPKPFIVTMRGTDESHIDRSARPIDEPLGTVSAGGFHHALVTPIIAGVGGRMGQSPERTVDRPLQTITAKADSVLVTPVIMPLTHQGDRRAHPASEPLPTITGAHRGELALISPTLINTRNGEREGQAPRVHDILKPAPTVTAKGSQGALVAAFLARHYGGHENDGAPMTRPMHTITTQDHHHLVHAFLMKYYGKGDGQEISASLGTVTTKDRFGLVTVMGDKYYIADIGMRMLVPRELFNAQSFPYRKETFKIKLWRDDDAPVAAESHSQENPETAQSAESYTSPQSSPGSNKPAVVFAHIDCARGSLALSSPEKSRLFANNAEPQASSPLPEEIAGFARRLVQGRTSVDPTAPSGKAELHPSDGGFTHLTSGENSACSYGDETTPCVADAESGMNISIEASRFITSQGGPDSQRSVSLLKTLSCYVARAIASSIPSETPKVNSFAVTLTVEDAYIIDPMVNGKPLTKTAQVRMAGNSVCRVMSRGLVRSNLFDRSIEVAEVA